jgi:hypothetical protein
VISKSDRLIQDDAMKLLVFVENDSDMVIVVEVAAM